jgi:hypothetical protein
VTETIRLAKRLFESGAEIAYTEAVVPYPGTPLREDLEREGLLRETGGAAYFAPRRGLGPERFFALCDLARAMNRLLHGEDPLFEARRVYRELSLLEFLLRGEVPGEFLEHCRRTPPDDFSQGAREIRSLEDRLRRAGMVSS